jgi:hypothetical protein
MRAATTTGGSGPIPTDEILKGRVQVSTGQQLGMDMANNFMLMLLFSLIADMSENPDGFRTDVLCDFADDYNCQGVPAEIAQEARDAAKQVIPGVLQNSKPLNRQRTLPK